MTVRSISLALAAAGTALLLTACSGGGGQAPSAGFTSSGGDCKSQKAQMSQLASQGVEGDIAAASAGKKLSADAQGRVDRYNGLLNTYLSSGCANAG